MSTIYSFLQKRKMHENQHGFILVFMAYAIAALMLALGSDTFYNIKSTAAGTSMDTEEEAQETVNVRMPDLHSRDYTVQLSETTLVNPYGLTDTGNKTTGGEEAAVESANEDTIWLLGSAMEEEEFDQLLQELDSLNLGKEESDKSDDNKKKEADTKKAAQETISSEYAGITDNEVKMLERIVEAEASGEDIIGKILIANVVLNRMEADAFPDSIKAVIFQHSNGEYQFSPVADDRYWSVKVSKETKKAVQRALKGEDYSKGALYFVARNKTSRIRWFDNHLDWLFKHGGHDFYKNK